MKWHVALINPDLTETYLGEVDYGLMQAVRSVALVDESPRWLKAHPRKGDEFFIVRDDGLLEWYCAEGWQPEPAHAETESGGPVGIPQEPLGAAGPAYIPGCERIGNQQIGGSMDYPGNPPRVVQHTTESGSGSGVFTSVASYFMKVASEPQVLYDPASDRLGQFGPLNLSARALKNQPNGRRTNREGKVCIQIEVCAQAAHPWTNGWDPAKKPNYQKFIAACRAWGVPDVFPGGPFPATSAQATHRSTVTWQSKGGIYGHSQVPGQDHWDPGAIDQKKLIYTKPSTPSVPAETTTYIVQRNDTLTKIAALFDTTVSYLVKLNALKDADSIMVGQALKVPKPKTVVYTVKSGDTLWGIAEKFKVKVSELKSKNQLKSDVILPGDVLKIP